MLMYHFYYWKLSWSDTP